jgi:hypothetical protein
MQDIGAANSFPPRFQALDPNQASIRWPSIRVENDQLVVNRSVNHPIIEDSSAALCELGIVRNFDWIAWLQRVVPFFDDPKLLKRARLQTCIKLVTLHARRERFVDRHFVSIVADGHITAILNRMGELRHTASEDGHA